MPDAQTEMIRKGKTFFVYTALEGGKGGGYINNFGVTEKEAEVLADQERKKPWNKIVNIVNKKRWC